LVAQPVVAMSSVVDSRAAVRDTCLIRLSPLNRLRISGANSPLSRKKCALSGLAWQRGIARFFEALEEPERGLQM
jgi:hypothetical protein